MITIEQCRAARGLLGWTQQDLANACGLSKTAINNFEKHHSDIKLESLRAIQAAFETAGIEFQGDNGLRKRKGQIEIIHGDDRFERLADNIIQTLAQGRKEVIVLNDQPTDAQTETLCMRLTSRNISIRTEDSKGITTYIYGPKVALQLRDNETIVIIDNLEASNAERARFDNEATNTPKPSHKLVRNHLA